MPGDVVEVRSAAEILATLDDEARTDLMPFMPEMLQFVGRQFTVTRRVAKICDTPGYVAGQTPRSRRLRETVYLDDLRCDGSAHGGCQAGCRLYWNEAWIRRINGVSIDEDDGGRPAEDDHELAGRARQEGAVRSGSGFRCQATEAPKASEGLSLYDPRQYVREVTSGNVTPRHLIRVLGGAVLAKLARLLHLSRSTPVPVKRSPAPRSTPADLRVGDLVRVRSLAEIRLTLDSAGRNRGLWFDDSEMANYCGGTFRVKDRVARFIDDRTGKMIELATDCLILDGVVCSGECSRWRWFCPRKIYSFWREDWLERIEEPSA